MNVGKKVAVGSAGTELEVGVVSGVGVAEAARGLGRDVVVGGIGVWATAFVNCAFTVWYAWVAFSSLGVSESAVSDELQPARMTMARPRIKNKIESEKIFVFMAVKRRLSRGCSISIWRADNGF